MLEHLPLNAKSRVLASANLTAANNLVSHHDDCKHYQGVDEAAGSDRGY